MLGGDIERNLGPRTYICRFCNTIFNKRQTWIQCNSTSKHWIHLKCSGIRLREYSPSFTCYLHTSHDSDSIDDHTLTSISTTSTEPDSPNQTANSSHSTNLHTTTDEDTPSPPQSPSSTDTSTHRQSTTRPKDFKIIQLNINGIRNKTMELTQLITTTTTKPKIVTIQETKLNPKLQTSQTTQPYAKTGQLTEEVDSSLTFITPSTSLKSTHQTIIILRQSSRDWIQTLPFI